MFSKLAVRQGAAIILGINIKFVEDLQHLQIIASQDARGKVELLHNFHESIED